MTNVSPLSGKDAWVKYFQSRGLSQEQAQTAVDTVDLSDGLNQEEAATLGLEAEGTIDRYIRQGWAADGEAGVETEEQGVNVMEADELERAYAAVARYADAHNISYEQAQRIYFQTDISFTRQSLSEVKTQREATRASWISEYNTKKSENPDLTFVDWAKERFGITAANDPVLANLEAYIGAQTDATPEQLVDYLLLNGFAARLAVDIQTDPAEGDNPGLGLSQAITGRIAPSDYQVATLEPFYRNAQAEAAPPPTETTASTETSGTTEASVTLDARRYYETMAALLKDHPGMTLQVGSFRYSWYNGQVVAVDTFGTVRAGEEVLSLLQESLSVFEGHFTEGDITGALSWISGQYGADTEAHLNLLLTIDNYISSGRQAYAGVEDTGYNDEDYNPANLPGQPSNPPQTEAPTERTIYSEQVPSDILGPDETTTAEQLLLAYPLSNDEISAQSREGKTALQTLARLYPGVSGWTAVLTETDNSIQGYLPADRAGMQIVTLAYELASLPTEPEPVAEETFDESGFRTEIGENGQEVWVFDGDSPAETAEETQVASSAVRASGDIGSEYRLSQDGRSQTAEQLVAGYETFMEPGESVQASLDRLSTQFGIYDWRAVISGEMITGWLPASAEGMLALTDGMIGEIPTPYVAANLERITDYDDGRDIPFNIRPTTPEIAAAPRVPTTPEADEPSPDNPRDITGRVADLRNNPPPAPATPDESGRPEIVPEPAVVPTVVAEAPAPPPLPPVDPRSQVGLNLAGLIESYNRGELVFFSNSSSALPGGEEYHSLKEILRDAENFIRELDSQNTLDAQFKITYLNLLGGLSTALQTPETADDQTAVQALRDLRSVYYVADGAESFAARGNFDQAITAYEGIDNLPAFLTARPEELRELRDAAVAQQTQLADLRLKAGEEYQTLLTYVSDNGLNDQDLTGNLAWIEAEYGRLDSTQDPAVIQKFIDSLPGVRTMGEEVVARREAGELAEANADVGTESAPAATRGRLGDIPINLNDYQLQIRWDGIFRNFRHIAQNLAQQTQQNITIKGYLCFNPATGEIAFSEIESDPYLYGSDGDLLTQSMAGARRDLRFNSMPEFPAGAYEADPSRGEGWYRVQIELYGERPR